MSLEDEVLYCLWEGHFSIYHIAMSGNAHPGSAVAWDISAEQVSRHARGRHDHIHLVFHYKKKPVLRAFLVDHWHSRGVIRSHR